MSRWTANSDRDYDEEVAGRTRFVEPDSVAWKLVQLVCEQCGAIFEVPQESTHPRRCRSCQALDALYAEHLKAKQGAA